MKAPLVFLTFNRPEATERGLHVIRQYRPNELYLVSDGPREGNACDQELVQRTRDVLDSVDWPCTVVRDYSAVNLGAGRRVASGLDNAFAAYEHAIVLEDDLVADDSFFSFCESMLERYADDERVMHVNGSGYPLAKTPGGASYRFSKLNLCWGWASWRRAWQRFQFDLGALDRDLVMRRIDQAFPNNKQANYWKNIFQYTHEHSHDIWDFQWVFAMTLHRGLAVTPTSNLVLNTGFTPEATNTPTMPHWYADMTLQSLSHAGALVHPRKVDVDWDYDTYVMNRVFLNRRSGIFFALDEARRLAAVPARRLSKLGRRMGSAGVIGTAAALTATQDAIEQSSTLLGLKRLVLSLPG